MKKLKSQLKTISKSLASLSQKVDKITQQIDKLQPPKAAPVRKKKAAAKKKAPVKKAVSRKKAPAKKAVSRKKAPAKKVSAKKDTVLNSVFNTIKKTRKGISIADLKAKTGLNSRQISNALYKLSKRDEIVAKARGVYVKK